MDTKTQTKKSIKGYGFGSLRLTTVLCIIFALLGAIVGGLQGLAVGIVMVLLALLATWASFIPFAGVFIFVGFYNTIADWLLQLVPNMAVLLAPDALPRVILFWVYTIISSIVCIFFSFLAIIAIIAGLVAIFEKRN